MDKIAKTQPGTTIDASRGLPPRLLTQHGLPPVLEAAGRPGHMVSVLSSDPSDGHVAPHGATHPGLTPNPVAAGIPCEPDPILIDVSTSITTAGMCAKARGAGTRLAGKWLI